MKRLNLSQYVRVTGTIIGFVFVLFACFGVQKSLASESVYQLNYDITASSSEPMWHFATSTLSGKIESIKIKIDHFHNSGDLTEFQIATTTLDNIYGFICNDYGTYDSVTKILTVTTADCTNLNNITFDNDKSYFITVRLRSTLDATVYGTNDYNINPNLLLVSSTYYQDPDYAYLKLKMTGDLPVIGLLHPAPNLTYGNPVKFSGGIINATEWNIYTGNEIDTTDNLQLSGFSANVLNDDFIIDHAFYLSQGDQYLNVVAVGQNGTDTVSYSFTVDNSVSSWGTSTVPIVLRTESDLEIMASTTASGFFTGLFDISACDFDFFSIYSPTNWGNCAINVFSYVTGWVSDNVIHYVDIALSKWPWGYGYRVLKIISGLDDAGSAVVPDLEFTIPADMGLPASAVGRSFEFNPIESYASAKATIIDSNEITWDLVLYWWNFFCYLTFAFYLVHKIKSFSI